MGRGNVPLTHTGAALVGKEAIDEEKEACTTTEVVR